MPLNIIIPAYNEACIIEETVIRLIQHMPADARIIIIDDGSEDNTPQIIKKLALEYPFILPQLNTHHKGYASVIRQGFSIVENNDIIVTLMADGCDDPKTIAAMYQEILNGADIVCASRYITGGRHLGGAWLKTLGSRAINRLLRIMKKVPFSDATNSFKMLRKSILDQICLKSSGFEIFTELTIKICQKNYRTAEIATTWRSRKKGKSKFLFFKNGLEYLVFLNPLSRN